MEGLRTYYSSVYPHYVADNQRDIIKRNFETHHVYTTAFFANSQGSEEFSVRSVPYCLKQKVGIF